MNNELLKALLKHDFYNEHVDKLHEDLFTGHIKTIFKLVQKAHEEYSTDIKPEWLRKLYDINYPASTTANTTVIAGIISDITFGDDIPDNLASDIIADAYRRRVAEDLAKSALEVWEGKTTNFNAIRQIYESRIDNVQEIPVDYEEIEFDLDQFLANQSEAGLWQFRLPTLRDIVPGVGPGTFGIMFGRPNAGKSALGVYEAAGHLLDKRKVGYFGNEEPADRLYLRMIQSLIEQDVHYIRDNTDIVKAEFAQYIPNIRVMDCVGMSIHAVDAWVKKNKPDVVFLDQLDKFYVEGSFQRSDERLGRLYEFAREIAKRHKCVVWGLCQASADGDGLKTLDMSMMAGAKTSKAAEADIVLGIGVAGHIPGGTDTSRCITICKNKINGRHDQVNCDLDVNKVVFNV